MTDSSVYVYFETTVTCSAASRLYARNPEVVSGTSVPEARRTTALPKCCSRFLSGEKCSTLSITRSPTTRSASPRRIGASSFGMSAASYWLSASVLTITSPPSLRRASIPAWNAAASPLLLVSRTTWSTPCARATSIVRSVEPSSTISHSTTSKPSTVRGRSRIVPGRVSSSFRQGIWMTSFMRRPRASIAEALEPPPSPLTSPGDVGLAITSAPRRSRAGAAGGDRDRRFRAPLPASRLRAALRLQPGRGLALHEPRGRDVRRRRRSGLLPEPVRLHVPRPPGTALRVRRRLAVRELRRGHPALRARPVGDLRRGAAGRGRARRRRRRGGVLRRPAPVGPAHRPRRSGGRGVRLPAHDLLADRADRRRHARADRAGAAVRGAGSG